MDPFSAVDHIGFSVFDLDRAIAFYRRLLNREEFSRKEWRHEYQRRLTGYPLVRVEGAFFNLPGGLVLELLSYSDPPMGRQSPENYMAGNAHLSLVTRDVVADFQRMDGYAEFRSPAPVEIEWGPYKGGFAGRMRDDDGITIELIQLPEGGPKFD